jgi:NADH:ubiquinone oxidoreductase subunit E
MLELRVCIGSACHLKGSYNIIQTFQQMIEEKSLHDKIDFKSTFCMRQCGNPGVRVSVNGEIHHLSAEAARTFFENVIIL